MLISSGAAAGIGGGLGGFAVILVCVGGVIYVRHQSSARVAGGTRPVADETQRPVAEGTQLTSGGGGGAAVVAAAIYGMTHTPVGPTHAHLEIERFDFI